jgi:TolA-binding protein
LTQCGDGGSLTICRVEMLTGSPLKAIRLAAAADRRVLSGTDGGRQFVSASKYKSASRIALELLLLAACLLPLCDSSRADDAALAESTAKYYRALRRRRLFKLAERYCLERLSHTDLSTAQRTDLTLELSRTLAEHADFVGNAEQDELWARSESALSDLLKQEPDNPRRLLLEVQRALLPATIGHSRRLIAELNPYDVAAGKRAADSLNTAIEALRATESRIAAAQRKTPASRPVAKEAIRPFELRTLLGNVRFRLAAATLDLALVQPAGSADQIASAREAQKVLKTVGESADDADLMWQARTAFVASSRLLADYAKTLRDIDSLEKLDPPPEFADRLLAERVRVLMAQREFRNAAGLLNEREKANSSVPGELQALSVELAITEWRAANPTPDAKIPLRLLQKLEERAARLHREVGGFWALRSEQLIHQVQDAQAYGAELAELVTKAQSAFNSGESAQAIELYGQAGSMARREGRPDLAFQFGFTRASIEIKMQNWDAAAADLIELTDRFPKNPKAAQAHLLATYALGKACDSGQTDDRRNAYARALAEHRARFTDDSTVPEATWMLAELEDRRGQSETALELYLLVPFDHKRGPAAQLAVARSFEMILDQKREQGEPFAIWEDRAVAALRKMLPAVREGETALNAQLAEVALRLARILLRKSPPQFEPADRLLARVLTSLSPRDSGTASPESEDAEAHRSDLRAMARQLQVISLAGQGQFQAARKLLGQLSATGPVELLRILDGLASMQSDKQRDPFRELGELQLEAALKLDEHRAELSKPNQRRLDECLARGYFASGQPQRGFEIYDALVQKSPRDRDLLLAYAGLLARCGSSACLTQAVSVWRKLEGLHEPGSRDWFPVRYELCQALLAAGQAAEARKLLQVTRLVFPTPEDQMLQKRFADLEVEASAAKSK